jgi:hypothetical protein
VKAEASERKACVVIAGNGSHQPDWAIGQRSGPGQVPSAAMLSGGHGRPAQSGEVGRLVVGRQVRGQVSFLERQYGFSLQGGGGDHALGQAHAVLGGWRIWCVLPDVQPDRSRPELPVGPVEVGLDESAAWSLSSRDCSRPPSRACRSAATRAKPVLWRKLFHAPGRRLNPAVSWQLLIVCVSFR